MFFKIGHFTDRCRTSVICVLVSNTCWIQGHTIEEACMSFIVCQILRKWASSDYISWNLGQPSYSWKEKVTQMFNFIYFPRIICHILIFTTVMIAEWSSELICFFPIYFEYCVSINLILWQNLVQKYNIKLWLQ